MAHLVYARWTDVTYNFGVVVSVFYISKLRSLLEIGVNMVFQFYVAFGICQYCRDTCQISEHLMILNTPCAFDIIRYFMINNAHLVPEWDGHRPIFNITKTCWIWFHPGCHHAGCEIGRAHNKIISPAQCRLGLVCGKVQSSTTRRCHQWWGCRRGCRYIVMNFLSILRKLAGINHSVTNNIGPIPAQFWHVYWAEAVVIIFREHHGESCTEFSQRWWRLFSG